MFLFNLFIILFAEENIENAEFSNSKIKLRQSRSVGENLIFKENGLFHFVIILFSPVKNN